MSNWDDDDFMGGGDDAVGGGNWDDAGDWGDSSTPAAAAADDWEQEDWETETKTEKKPAGPSKKTLKQIAKEKEEAEKAAKAKQQKALEDEQRRLENDPEYRKQLREQEKRAQENAELESISDLFGPSVSKPVGKQVFRQESNPERARELAAASGLGDGAGGFEVAGTGDDWDQIPHVDREGPPPGSLDALPFATDQDLIQFTKVLAAKVKAVGTAKTTNNTQTMSKVLLVELIRALGPDMKSQDVDEVLRVSTVIKNDLTKKTQNVKKGKGKKQVKLHDNGRDYSDDEDFM